MTNDLERLIEVQLAQHGGSWTWGGPNNTEPIVCGCSQWRGSISAHRTHQALEVGIAVREYIRESEKSPTPLTPRPEHTAGCIAWRNLGPHRLCICHVSNSIDFAQSQRF